MSSIVDRIATQSPAYAEMCMFMAEKVAYRLMSEIVWGTEQAVREQIAADIQRRKRDLADGYADIARAMLETGMEEAARIAEGNTP